MPNRVWRNLDHVGLQYHEEHLWITLQITGQDDVNLLGTGPFKVFGKEGDQLVELATVQQDIAGPARMVLFTQQVPALTTIKIFDKDNRMRFHLMSEEDVDIQ